MLFRSVVHHPTKDISRGKELVNSVSGSGLSSTLSKSKMHLYLDQVINKQGEVIDTRLRHIKANYVPSSEQWRKPISLVWSDNSLLHVDPKIIEELGAEERKEVGEINEVSKVSVKRTRSGTRKRSRLPEEQVIIERNESLLSEESKRLAEQNTRGPFGHSMARELMDLKNSKGSKDGAS